MMDLARKFRPHAAWPLLLAAAAGLCIRSADVHAQAADDSPAARSLKWPPPPQPPTPPPGVAEAYYSTCAGTHPPVIYVKSNVQPGDPGYPELIRYIRSNEYRRYEMAVRNYKEAYNDDEAGFGTVDPITGQLIDSETPEPAPRTESEGPPTRDTPGSRRRARDAEKEAFAPTVDTSKVVEADESGALSSDQGTMEDGHQAAYDNGNDAPKAGSGSPAFGSVPALPAGPQRFMGYDLKTVFNNATGNGKTLSAQRVERNPKEDLVRWFRGFLYHEKLAEPLYEGGEAEPAQPASAMGTGGAAPSVDTYRHLTTWLNLPSAQRKPTQKQMLDSMYPLWTRYWRANLGFDADPECRRAREQLELARVAQAQAADRVDQLQLKAAESEAGAARVKRQLDTAKAEAEAVTGKIKDIEGLIARRKLFIDCAANLLRLKSEGFGDGMARANLTDMQAAASRILIDIGPLCADPVCDGFFEDLTWLQDNAGDPKSEAYQKHLASTLAAERVLKNFRVDGLPAVSRWIVEHPDHSPAVLDRAFEMLAEMGARKVRQETVDALPVLAAKIRMGENGDKAQAAQARKALLRLLSAVNGKANVVGVLDKLVPLLKIDDAPLTGALQKFLSAQTGQNLGANPQAWLDWQQKQMFAPAPKPTAEKK